MKNINYFSIAMYYDNSNDLNVICLYLYTFQKIRVCFLTLMEIFKYVKNRTKNLNTHNPASEKFNSHL